MAQNPTTMPINQRCVEVNWCNWKSTVVDNTTTLKVIETKQKLEAKSALPNTPGRVGNSGILITLIVDYRLHKGP